MLGAEADQFKQERQRPGDAVSRVIVDSRAFQRALTAIFCGGNVLLEGVLTGKTELVKALSRVLGSSPADSITPRPDAGRYRRHEHHDQRRSRKIPLRISQGRSLRSYCSPTRSTGLRPNAVGPARNEGWLGHDRRHELPVDAAAVLATQNPIEQKGRIRLERS